MRGESSAHLLQLYHCLWRQDVGPNRECLAELCREHENGRWRTNMDEGGLGKLERRALRGLSLPSLTAANAQHDKQLVARSTSNKFLWGMRAGERTATAHWEVHLYGGE